ncbi:MAG TPA: PA14 domain-containing protein, partial [Polyangia bacterium]
MERRSMHHTFLALTAAVTAALAGCGEQPDSAAQAGERIEDTDSAALSSGTGLHAEYFNNQNLTAPAALSRDDRSVSFEWADGSPEPGVVAADNFSVRWTGQVEPRYTQTYTFYTVTDDGVRLWVDGQLVIDDWTDHGRTEDQGTIALTAGQKVDIRMEFYENNGNAVATLSWSSSSQAKQLIPQRRLYPSPTASGGTSSGTGGATASGGATAPGGATASGG